MSAGLFFTGLIAAAACAVVALVVNSFREDIARSFGGRTFLVMELAAWFAGMAAFAAFFALSVAFRSASHLMYSLAYDHVEFIEYSDRMPNEKPIDWSRVVEQTESATCLYDDLTRYRQVIVAWNDPAASAEYDKLVGKGAE